MKSQLPFWNFVGIHPLITMMIILRGVVQAFRPGSALVYPLEASLGGIGILPIRNRRSSFSGTFPTRTERTKLYLSTETSRTLAPGSHVSEMEVKKSRFLGHAKHVEIGQKLRPTLIKSRRNIQRHGIGVMGSKVESTLSQNAVPTMENQLVPQEYQY
jgi:hypothetical protein